MVAIEHLDAGLLNRRMALEISADQPAIPGPVVLSVAGRVNSDKSTAGAYESLECRLLIVIEHRARGVQEHDHLVVGQVLVGKLSRVFGRVDVEIVLGA